MALKIPPSLFIHRGPWLKRTRLDSNSVTMTEVAKHLGVSRKNMSVLLNSHASLTAIMALRFERSLI